MLGHLYPVVFRACLIQTSPFQMLAATLAHVLDGIDVEVVFSLLEFPQPSFDT